MAGSHERGLAYSRPDLFRDAACVVTEPRPTPQQQQLCEFWRALGARVVIRDPADHDAQVAWMSHVPHLLAYAFADALGAAPPESREVAGRGFRDFTRIARSEPEMWGDIFTANRKALSAPLQAVGDALARMGRAIEANDHDVLESAISAARDSLSHFPECADTESERAGESHLQSENPNTDDVDRAGWRGAARKPSTRND
jgi:prephenate dehydrogenase